MRKIFESVIIIFLIIIILLMSLLLLSYNEYHVSQFGDYSLLIANSDMLGYKKNSLLVVKSVELKDIKENDYVFYCERRENDVKTVLSNVKRVSVDQDKVILTNGTSVDKKYLIGTNKSTKEYKKIGFLLSVLESKKGNLFFIVIPAFLLFSYELYNIIREYRENKIEVIN